MALSETDAAAAQLMATMARLKAPARQAYPLARSMRLCCENATLGLSPLVKEARLKDEKDISAKSARHDDVL